MTVHFTSDLHIGHRRVAEIRGFSSAHEHDEHLAASWRAVVKPADQVWVLGDIAASSPTRALEVLADLPGEKHLIFGNHDTAHPMNRDAHRHLRTYLEVFASAASAARRRINGREVVLSHFPYRRDRGPARHQQWRLRDEGLWLLHGHTHGPETLTYGEREIHVGLDAWALKPVALETIADLLEAAENRRQSTARLDALFAAGRRNGEKLAAEVAE
ncbi:metallophosphoesterase family protein [Amycolatopsis sp. PS_44_ISF1]|uniref:metallophosphoesterase family protein n=1 Tax=Amycolatopsis sp. PS_44_ISF1 TaxID=2974917 RepID=UPI0028DECCD9|nr:metallophosphoesterase family protein [Amycolatopsis sp. PS_44_ISF1]MDT8915809.1 metallophosphoesterase family protein [Amycolatopsis sp. PS_44_ISF1]